MPYGTVNADVIGTSVAGSNIGAGNASIMKNRIINGAMVIDQRNAGASVTPTNGVFSVDRWSAQLTQASKFSFQQNAGAVTPPVGFTKYLGVTSLSAYSVLSSDYFLVKQNIEGFNSADLAWGTANAKTVTLSFWAYSSLTGTFSVGIYNAAGTSCYPATYTISVANTWQQVSITIAGSTSATWNTDNSIGITVAFGLGAGSTYSATANTWNNSGSFTPFATGATSVVGTNGATFYITGVQLEVGSSATGFEYRQYGQELALCQRYLPVINFTAANQLLASGQAVLVTQGYFYLPFNVNARTAPTGITTSAASSLFMTNNIGASAGTYSSTTFAAGTTSGGTILGNTSAGLVTGNATMLGAATAGQILFTGCEL